MSKVLIWLASGERSKLLPGVLWGTNAKRRGWVDEVRVVVFGDSEQTVMQDDELFSMVQKSKIPSFAGTWRKTRVRSNNWKARAPMSSTSANPLPGPSTKGLP